MKKNIDYKKVRELKKEINYYSSQKQKEAEEIIDRMNYKNILLKNLRIFYITATAILLIGIVILLIIHGNFLKYNVEHFNYLNLIFEIILALTGFGFITTSFSKKIKPIFKKESLKIGIQILLLVICLAFIFFGGFSL